MQLRFYSTLTLFIFSVCIFFLSPPDTAQAQIIPQVDGSIDSAMTDADRRRQAQIDANNAGSAYTTKATCDEIANFLTIRQNEVYPDCAQFAPAPNESNEPGRYLECLQEKISACTSICSDCSGVGTIGDDRTVPDNYSGPLPACAFTTQGCRDINNLLELAVNVARYIFGILGTIALVFFIYGGLTIILSFGNSSKVQKGRDILVAAVVGLLIALSAFLIVNFLVQTLGINSEFTLQ